MAGRASPQDLVPSACGSKNSSTHHPVSRGDPPLPTGLCAREASQRVSLPGRREGHRACRATPNC